MAKPRSAPRTSTRTKKSPAKAPKASTKASKPAPRGPDHGPSREAAIQVARWALDKKALDVVVLDVRGLSSYADYIVLATAESEPQLNAIADRAEEGMKERGERPLGIEGAGAGRWLLLDFGDVVLHAFYQDAREFYDLEGLWADAPRVPVVDKP